MMYSIDNDNLHTPTVAIAEHNLFYRDNLHTPTVAIAEHDVFYR